MKSGFGWIVWVLAMVLALPVQAQDTTTLLSTASEQLAEAQFDEAIATFQQVIAAYPQNLDAYNGLVRTYGTTPTMSFDDKKQLIEDAVRQMLAIDPQSPLANVQLARWTRIYADDFAQGRAEARVLVDQVLVSNPDFVPALIELAVLTYFQEPETAISAIDRAVLIAPDSADVLYQLASVERFSRKNVAGQLDALNRTLAVDPRYWQAYLSRASVYENLGRYEQALTDASLAAERIPFSGSFTRIASAHYGMGQYAEAVSAAEQSLGIDFNQLALVVAVGSAIRMGNPAAAVAYLDTHATKNTDEWSVGQMALMYYQSGAYNQALTLFETAETAQVISSIAHLRALENLRACVPTATCQPHPQMGGYLPVSVTTDGRVSDSGSSWAFRGTAGQVITLVVTVDRLLEVSLHLPAQFSTEISLQFEVARPSQPFIARTLTLSEDGYYEVRITGINDDYRSIGAKYRMFIKEEQD